MSRTTKLICIHALCHIGLAFAVVYGEAWMFLFSFIWWQAIAITAISAGYHRYFSHNAYQAPAWYPVYAQIVALFANPGPVLTWASAHRMHHAYSDTDKDPHSPVYKGFWRVYASMWGNDVTIERRMLRGLKTPSTQFFYRHYFKLSLSVAIILTIIDPMLLLFVYCVPVVFAFHGYGLINTITHIQGFPKNSVIANILTGGEGWHANHHADSKNWRIGKHWWQLDPGAAFIKLIKK